MFGPPLPIPVPLPLPLPLPGAPSPGAMVAGAGNAMQAIENAVGDAIGGVLGALTGRPPEGKKEVSVQLPDGRAARLSLPDGVITTETFQEFASAVGQAFQAVRQDLTRLKSLSAANAARSGLYGFGDEEESPRGGMDPLMLMLLLKDRDGATGGTGAPIDTTTLMLMLMNDGGFGGGSKNNDLLMLLLALGKL